MLLAVAAQKTVSQLPSPVAFVDDLDGLLGSVCECLCELCSHYIIIVTILMALINGNKSHTTSSPVSLSSASFTLP